MSQGILSQIRQAAADYLRGQSALHGWEVVEHKRGAIGSLVEEAIAHSGNYLVVHLPLPTAANANIPGWADALALRVEVGERPDFNNSGTDAPTACEIVWASLTGWQPGIEGVQPFYPARRVIEEVPAKTADIYLVNFASAGGITITP